MRKLITFFVLIGAILSADSASHRKAAEDLLKAAEFEKTTNEAIEAILGVQFEAQPYLVPLEETLRTFFRKHMSAESMKEDMIKLYVEEFTEPELKEITAFYGTDLGKKVISRVPALMQKGAEMGQRRIEAHLPELQAILEEEMQRLMEEQQAS